MGFSLIFGLLSMLLELVFGNYQSTQSKTVDIQRKTDVNSMHQKLEEHYNDYGEYPTETELTTKYDQILPGIDPEALRDEDGNLINQGGNYIYTPENCTATGCETYKLSATLNDGSKYTKVSLN